MKINELLDGSFNNYIFPFFWVHGESEEVYRENVRAVYNANIRAFCVESRPHENFCKEQWWNDLDIILDEAEQLNMKVWILDDKLFPVGSANGAIEKAPLELRKQSILSKEIVIDASNVRIDIKEECQVPITKLSMTTDLFSEHYREVNRFKDDRFLCATAISLDERVTKKPKLLNGCINDGILEWEKPAGRWKIVLCYLSRNAGVRRNYMNMLEMDSVKILIKEVYEQHYAHYKDKFGKVIAGFFSDEPELGNGNIYYMYNLLGTDQDLPWSRTLESTLMEKWGSDYFTYLPMLWNNDCGKDLTAKVRYDYMDTVTRLVEANFSKQIGSWCRNHGVEYIGHVIEDNNQHARTGTSLGHFFRGLKWQSMSGIDIIGGQIYPQGEDAVRFSIWDKPTDTEFYHYALAKLGSSLGDLNPNMKGRTMCELFGNYTWSEGVRLEKYLLDHCMVRGINRLVPHAFSCKAYPDPDCPPHFYANGNDPLYRHFAELMGYTNRVTSLLETGTVQTPVAILYHGEAEWTGDCMLMQKPARILQDNQIDFHFVPGDIFSESDFYRTEVGRKLIINNKEHSIFVIPYSQYITKAVAEGALSLKKAGCPVLFLDRLPEGLCEGGKLPDEIKTFESVPLEQLLIFIETHSLKETRLNPASNRIRTLHSKGEEEILYLFNESDTVYEGTVQPPWKEETILYDAWENISSPLDRNVDGFQIRLRPSESCFLIKKEGYHRVSNDRFEGNQVKHPLMDFQIGYCRSIDYPNFMEAKCAMVSTNFAEQYPLFSGFIRYSTSFDWRGSGNVALEITDAYEGVEVFVNGVSSGIQVIPAFLFDLTSLCRVGKNELRIEVATTLERENKQLDNAAPTGITGQVNLIISNNK